MPLFLRLQYLRQALLRMVPPLIWPKIINHNGTLVPLRQLDTSFGNKYLILTGQYELPELVLASLFLERGMNVIEIGSSIGILSSFLAKQIGLRGSLVCIEGSKQKQQVASKWLNMFYPNIRFQNSYCIPAWNFHKPLFSSHIEESVSTLGGRPLFDSNKLIDLDRIPIVSIADIYAKFKLERIDALVIDIEGSEEELLDHNLNYPDSLRFILIELHPLKYSAPRKSDELIALFCRSGFTLAQNISDSYLFVRKRSTGTLHS